MESGGVDKLVLVEEGEIVFESVTSEEGGVVKVTEEGLDARWNVHGLWGGGDYAGPFVFEGEV